MRPVVAVLMQRGLDVEVWLTGQHRELLDLTAITRELHPVVDLGIMTPNQTPHQILTATLEQLLPKLDDKRPDLVLAQGDTSSVLATALACHYTAIPFGHVEAGLRTYDLNDPFPEEMNRQVTSRIAALHFAPTRRAERNLLQEGIPQESIIVTGNTIVDALQATLDRLPMASSPGHSSILATVHRRENRGMRLESICRALVKIVETHPSVTISIPVHPACEVTATMHRMLDNKPGIELLQPLSHVEFVRLLLSSTLVLTDSGGVLEEAVTLGKPTLILRDKTERPEAIESGFARLVGADTQAIVSAASAIISSAAVGQVGDLSVADPVSRISLSPFGVGQAAQLIADAVEIWYEKRQRGKS